MLTFMRARLKALLRSEDGNVLILAGVAGFMMITATGVAVDMGRAQILQAKIQVALDAAGLAAGATANEAPSGNDSNGNPWTSATWVQSQATRYFNANFPTGYLGSAPVTPVTTLTGTANQIISLSASTTQSTTFLKAVGINSVSVGTSAQITRANSGMELVLVMDNTGSMGSAVNPGNSSTPKITAAKSAATQLINILYGSGTTVPNLWVGLVPFSQAVNIDTSYTGWMDTAFDNALDFGPIQNGSNCPNYTGTTPATAGSYNSSWWSGSSCSYTLPGSTVTNFGISSNWAGCVLSRSPTAVDSASGLTYDIADAAPTSTVANTLFRAYDFPDSWKQTNSNWNNGSPTMTTSYYFPLAGIGNNGPNELCPPEITPLVSSKTTVLNAISAMSAGGSTFIDIGMAWGWRMISPNWAGVWGGEMNATGNATYPQLPLAYNTALMNKVVILMTDGMNSFTSGNFTTYGYLSDGTLGTSHSIYDGYAYSGSAEEQLDNRTQAICTALKSHGVLIYTIGFGQNDNNNTGDQYSVNGTLLRNCASNPGFYFLAPTNAQLQTVFQQIGDSLANLRVSQ